jgi:hypothetical protein
MSMRWKVVYSVTAVLAFVGLAMGDSFTAVITKVDGGKVTFKKFLGFNKEEKKIDLGEEMTLPVAADVKVSKGKFNKEEKKIVADTPIEGGVKGEAFKNIPEKGMFASITTSTDNKKITEIVVGGFGKGKKKKDQ